LKLERKDTDEYQQHCDVVSLTVSSRKASRLKKLREGVLPKDSI
jgi:hypothetical protein